MNWLIGIGIASFSFVMGYILCGLLSSKTRIEECLECDVLQSMSQELDKVKKSRDLFRDRYEQELMKNNSLKISNGLLRKARA